MTAQAPDRVRYRGAELDLVAVAGAGLFDPTDHGVEFTMTSTANWRGFQARYSVRRGSLVLARLDDVGIRAHIDELYVHMGFAPAWKFQRVHELVFDAGRLLRAHDRSADPAAFRAAILACEVADPGTEAAAWPAGWFGQSSASTRRLIRFPLHASRATGTPPSRCRIPAPSGAARTGSAAAPPATRATTPPLHDPATRSAPPTRRACSMVSIKD